MTIHREGYGIITIVILLLLAINLAVRHFFPTLAIVHWILIVASIVFLGFILNFFRSPKIAPPNEPDHIYAPADGEVVIIEEVYEKEYFQDQRLQVSIFMSIYDVHQNRVPVKGEISYVKYHPGKFLVARLPKSSELNERNSVAVKAGNGTEILMRQIAGFVARRIRCYVKPGEQVEQTQEFGFIRFGSRVDVFLPLGTPVNVNIGEHTKAGKTVLAQFK